MWQDSDVPVQIKDLSYAGKLAAKSNEESDKGLPPPPFI
jgi:hypothetical protein